MVKKVLSFFLATMLMMSVLSVSASTGTVATSGFDGTLSTTTNEETEVVTYSYTDDVWNITNSGAYRALGTTGLLTSESVALEIVNESAESSNKVLQATQLVGTPGTDFAKNDSSLSTNAVALAENDTVYISFDFKVPAGNTERWMIGAGGVQSTGSWQYRDQTLFVLYNLSYI